MPIDPDVLSKVMDTRRCTKANINEIIDIFVAVNDGILQIVEKLLVKEPKWQEQDKRNLHLLLNLQNRLVLLKMEAGINVFAANLFDNQRYRAYYLRQSIREAERRHDLKILDENDV